MMVYLLRQKALLTSPGQDLLTRTTHDGDYSRLITARGMAVVDDRHWRPISPEQYVGIYCGLERDGIGQ